MRSKNSTKNSTSPKRLLPSVDALLKTATAHEIGANVGADKLTELARAAIAELRNGDFSAESSKKTLMARAETVLREKFEVGGRQRLQRVINATGVIIHTNLGRAPLADAARTAIFNAAEYCNLEYDLETGRRGKRGREVEELLCELTGAEAALIANNCAAAALLVLTALGAGGEAVISRGELVEIGGDFRVPDVMAQSGVKMVEVGTTNRTKLNDFAVVVNENTRLFVRVHPSNFRLVGFTAMPDLPELAELAHEKNIFLYEDAGSGALVDLSAFGLTDEPVIADSIKSGADVVTFSGDKLLGGCQAGLIVGTADSIERLRKHPLYRALRVDKTAYAMLAATLDIYRKGEHFNEIPVLKMLSQTKTQIELRAKNFIKTVQETITDLKPENWNLKLVEGASAVGGGSAPLAELPTMLVAINSTAFSAVELERRLRLSSPPIVARIAEDRVLFDLRTVSATETNEILSALKKIALEKSEEISEN